MTEYLSEGLVLDNAPSGDLDVRVSVFTRKFGKFMARAKSAKKPISKLAPHLNPGTFARVRLIEKNGLQVADALQYGKSPIPAADLYHLNRLLPEAESDRMLWNMLATGPFSWRNMLAMLGWDPRDASCLACGKRTVAAFHTNSQDYFCETCAGSHPNQKELLYMAEYE